jgi:carboxyl-terminal processing protease
MPQHDPKVNLKRFIAHLQIFALAIVAGAARPSATVDRTEGNIAQLTAKLLQGTHFEQMPLDDKVSSKFFDRYLQSLDGLYVHFLQSDLKDFEHYRTTLDDLTLKGDTSPAHRIFARFLERLEARVSYATNLLATETFEFTGDDRHALNRKDLPRPKDIEEARQLWRQHLRYEYLQDKLNDKEHEQIVKTITGRYTRLLHFFKGLTKDEVFEIYLSSLTRVYDPHSDYMGRAQLENFSISMKLSLTGIGAELTVEDGYCTIRKLIPNGPAERSKKLKASDRIIAVAQGAEDPVDVVDEPLSKVVQLIRGPKGSEVRLTVIPSDAADSSVRKVVTLLRDEIKLEDQEAKAKLIELPSKDGEPQRLGLIDLPSFYADFQLDGKRGGEVKSTTADVTKLIQKLKEEKISGLILDLRRNGGGSLEEAINLTGLFIKKGPVVQVKDTAGRITLDSALDPNVLYDGPLVILTSRFSASASEILAGALQDYGRALIVGDSSTHGKGTVQSLLQLDQLMHQNRLDYAYNPGALKLTIRKFYRASGASTQRDGVVPDVILPSINNHREIGESALDNPMPPDEIPSARYETLNRVEPYLARLRKSSEERIKTDQDFAYLLEDIELFKKALENKSVSLNEEQRRSEKTEKEARDAARKKERQARKEPDWKLYEITLKDTELPGLPPPVAKTAPADPTLAATPGSGDLVAETEPGDLEEEHGAEDKTRLDMTLEEAKRVLIDYIGLLEKEQSTVVLAK